MARPSDFVPVLFHALVLAALVSSSLAQPAFCPKGNHASPVPGPSSPAVASAWLANLTATRAALKAQWNYNSSVYDSELFWTERLYIAPQSHIYDRFLYDSDAAEWTVDLFLDDLATRYGPIDGVLLWGTYPNMGVDERNQFQITFEDVPGGVAALRDIVITAFHVRGVRVGIPYNPWDVGTSQEAATDAVTIAQYAKEVGFDFVNGDTLTCIDASYFSASVAAGAPLAFQPEGNSAIYGLGWTKSGWGEGWPLCPGGCIPPVDIQKWVEPRHTSAICDRWAGPNTGLRGANWGTDHSQDIMQAFFNGDGFVTWENVWGFWNGMTPRDSEATRRLGALLRFLAPFLVSQAWQPHTVLAADAAAASVYASLWPSPAGVAFPHAASAWTIVNTNNASNYTGPALLVPCGGGDTVYYDVYAGRELAPVSYPAGGCALSLSVELRGLGAVIGVSPADAAGNATLSAFLAAMAQMTGHALEFYASEAPLLTQTMRAWGTTTPLPPTPAPAGMTLIPAVSDFAFVCQGTEIEGRFWVYGDDVQFPFEALPSWLHNASLSIPAFFIDTTPVTNAQYAAFLNASGYAPADTHNFLRDWAGSLVAPPPGWASKPVTWVDADDAAAFCTFYAKRLPNDWEWQYAMQGGDGRTWPYGDELDWSRMPPQVHGRTRPAPPDVGSYPNGTSPFGVLDGSGLVWQWTNLFRDDHTAGGLVRGGSYWGAEGSKWYFPNINGTEGPLAGSCATHNKLLLMSSSYNRHGTVGFRCVADVEQK